MVKTGSERSAKFSAKHDPETLLLRWKVLQDFSVNRFDAKAYWNQYSDEIIKAYCDLYNMEYGQRGVFCDKIRKYVYGWHTMTETEKAAWKADWLREGLPEELFDKLAEFDRIVKNVNYYMSQRKLAYTYYIGVYVHLGREPEVKLEKVVSPEPAYEKKPISEFEITEA